MQLAFKTIAAIDSAIEADGGALFRTLQKEEFAKLTDAFSPKQETFRSHLGASIIGRPCAREIWFSWHWCTKPSHSAKTLRLFNRGHLEEARFLAMLRLIGCQTWSTGENGKQLGIKACGGHFGGSMDAVALGIPDCPEIHALAEFKTHGEKSFNLLKSEGVKQSKWEHYVQMNVYARSNALPLSLYLAVNKNTDELYGELVPVDVEVADRYLARAQGIIDSAEPPDRINASPGWYQCKFCDHHKLCHDFAFPEKNCRTCCHSTPIADKGWHCTWHEAPISPLCESCPSYVVNPSILNGIEILEANADQNWMRFRKKDNEIVDTREL